jgi:hypothetical protein
MINDKFFLWPAQQRGDGNKIIEQTEDLFTKWVDKYPSSCRALIFTPYFTRHFVGSAAFSICKLIQPSKCAFQ